MNSERSIEIRGNKIEEYYWGGKYVVYRNNTLVHHDFDEEVRIEQERADNTVKPHRIDQDCNGLI